MLLHRLFNYEMLNPCLSPMLVASPPSRSSIGYRWTTRTRPLWEELTTRKLDYKQKVVLPRVEAGYKEVDHIPVPRDLDKVTFSPIFDWSFLELNFISSLRCYLVKIKKSRTFSRISGIRLQVLVTLCKTLCTLCLYSYTVVLALV